MRHFAVVSLMSVVQLDVLTQSHVEQLLSIRRREKQARRKYIAD